jgi:hypothetical protein
MDVFLIIPVSLSMLLVLHASYHYWPRSPHAQASYHLREWFLQARLRGLSAQEQVAEMHFRLAWVQMRQAASVAVVASPKAYRDIVSSCGSTQAKALALIDKSVAKRFLIVLQAAPLSDVLYEDAMIAVNKFWDDAATSCTERQRIPDATVIAAFRSF